MTDLMCAHERLKPGPNIPRRYGSYQSEVCEDCGAWRTKHHTDNLWRGEWESADALDEAATESGEL